MKSLALTALAALVLLSACAGAPTDVRTITVLSRASDASATVNPHFNLEVILRGDGFGHVSFRQSNEDTQIVTLDTWVRDLEPNTSYLLQRAADPADGVCTSAAWLTLGKGSTPATIDTDDNGTGRADLFRNLSAFAEGTAFDIRFRVVNAATNAVVLTSECYQFFIR